MIQLSGLILAHAPGWQTTGLEAAGGRATEWRWWPQDVVASLHGGSPFFWESSHPILTNQARTAAQPSTTDGTSSASWETMELFLRGPGGKLTGSPAFRPVHDPRELEARFNAAHHADRSGDITRAWRGEIGGGSSDSRYVRVRHLLQAGFSAEEIVAIVCACRWYNIRASASARRVRSAGTCADSWRKSPVDPLPTVLLCGVRYCESSGAERIPPLGERAGTGRRQL